MSQTRKKQRAKPKDPKGSAPAKRPLKVAIVGFTPSRGDAPWDDPSWEIWGLNALYKFPDVTRADRWFDVHDFGVIPDERLKQYVDMDIPVYMQAAHPKVPNAVVLPVSEIESELGDYVTNSISWMIAVAILEGAEAIHVYGIDMATDDEYRYQRPNLEYFLGIARGRGIDVHVPEHSDLLGATHKYGFEKDNGLRRKMLERKEDFVKRRQVILQKIAGHEQEIEKHNNEIIRLHGIRQTMEGALQQVQWFLQSWSIPDRDTKTQSPILSDVESGGAGDMPTAPPLPNDPANVPTAGPSLVEDS